MFIPSRDECIELQRQFDMPGNIRRHSLLVAEVALFIASGLNADGSRLDMQVIEAGALLHDIGKAYGLNSGENHAAIGAGMLEGVVAPAVAQIVAEHITLDSSQVAGPITESLVVNYSDKRVKHDLVVSVEERYKDLIERYAKEPEHVRLLLEKLDLYITLERTIFSRLPIMPDGPEIMGISIDHPKVN
jgi:putative nucleotidyltransferase with HDIG domain